MSKLNQPAVPRLKCTPLPFSVFHTVNTHIILPDVPLYSWIGCDCDCDSVKIHAPTSTPLYTATKYPCLHTGFVDCSHISSSHGSITESDDVDREARAHNRRNMAVGHNRDPPGPARRERNIRNHVARQAGPNNAVPPDPLPPVDIPRIVEPPHPPPRAPFDPAIVNARLYYNSQHVYTGQPLWYRAMMLGLRVAMSPFMLVVRSIGAIAPQVTHAVYEAMTALWVACFGPNTHIRFRDGLQLLHTNVDTNYIIEGYTPLAPNMFNAYRVVPISNTGYTHLRKEHPCVNYTTGGLQLCITALTRLDDVFVRDEELLHNTAQYYLQSNLAYASQRKLLGITSSLPNV